MRVQALRGVCVGVGQNMRGPQFGPDGKEREPGEIRELDDDTAKYLKAIKAVQDAPAERPATNMPESGRKER